MDSLWITLCISRVFFGTIGLRSSFIKFQRVFLDASHGHRPDGHQGRHASISQSHYSEMPAVDRPPRLVDVLSQLSSQVWGAYGRSRERAVVHTQLKKDATPGRPGAGAGGGAQAGQRGRTRPAPAGASARGHRCAGAVPA